jgi:type II intron maturase
MMSILAEKIHDNRFLRLMRNMLQAGYLEDWRWNATLSGVPQGGVVSPVLSDIYLDRMDIFAETVLIPEYTRGQARVRNPAYRRAESAVRRARRRGDRAAVRELRQQLRSMPSMDPHDPGYRRLRYARYADDALLGFTGPKAGAEEIKTRLAQFLREDLKLELSKEKTLITHARTQAARFLGYEITVAHDDRKRTRGHRWLNGTVQLRVPKTVIKAKCAPYLKRGKPASRPELKDRDDHAIISIYGAQYRGLVQYYLLAGDVWRLGRLEWVLKTSMLKTLAHRHRSTVTKMADKYKAVIATPHGPRRCFEARVERHGRKPLVAPGPQARRPHPARPAATRVGTAHGQNAQEDPPGLPHLPPGHPRGTARHETHAIVTGEPDARKRARPVRAGGRRERTRSAGTSPTAYRNTRSGRTGRPLLFGQAWTTWTPSPP